MEQHARIRFVSLVIIAAASAALAGCDNGAGGGSGGAGSTSVTGTTTGSPSGTTGSTTATGSTGATTGTASSGGMPLTCASGYCSYGMGGYAFSYADSMNATPPNGTSTATLASGGELCISGHVMQLPMNPTPQQYSSDWGCGLGINVNQAMGMSMPINNATLTGSGVTVTSTGVPSCTQARIVVTNAGMDYCATWAEGTPIPWSMFNTECWMPSAGTPLAGPPDTPAVKFQFVTQKAGACDFTNWCLTSLSL